MKAEEQVRRGAIASLVPEEVVSVETREDLVETDLFAEEAEVVANAVPVRRREFVTGRALARDALARLGSAPVAIATGDRGEPLWPDGVAGSITHCRGFRACAVARTGDVRSVGIDAEVHEPLPDGVAPLVASPIERERLAAARSALHLEKVLFSAKESIFKAWWPLTRQWLDFEDADLTLDVEAGRFHARVLIPAPAGLTEFEGRWAVDGGIVLTAVVV